MIKENINSKKTLISSITMDNTSIQEKKELILKTRRRGDTAIVCKQVGFSVQIFWTAMKRNDNDYTDAELIVIEGMYRKMLERLELRQRVGLTL